MVLAYIVRGMKMSIFVEIDKRTVSDVFEADFKYLENDTVIAVQCAGLSGIYDNLNWDAQLHISYSDGPKKYSFKGRIMDKKRGSDIVLIEQLSSIETVNRRQYERDEFRVSVRLFGIPNEKLDDLRVDLWSDEPEISPDMQEMTFDISIGGLCIITDKKLASDNDPYYFVQFKIGDRDHFLLPSKLVRRSDYQRTKIGKYDYGFQFIFDKIPEEKKRLTKAILRRKLSL